MRGWKDKYLLTVTMTMNVYETVGGWPWGKTMTKSPGRRYIISKQQSNIYSFIQHTCRFLSIQPKQKRLFVSHSGSFVWVFLFQALCFVIVFYVLDIFWIRLTFLSLGLVTLRALLIACLSFSVCVWCLFFSMCYIFWSILAFSPKGVVALPALLIPCLSFVSFFFLLIFSMC